MGELLDIILRLLGVIRETGNETTEQAQRSQRTFVIAVVAVTVAIILTLIFANRS